MIFWLYTIEEKVIEWAYKKLAVDAMVIQQRGLAEHKIRLSHVCLIFPSELYRSYMIDDFNLF